MFKDEEPKYVTAAGTYVAKVKSPGNGWFGEAGEKKTPFIRVPFIVTEDGPQKGREIVWRGYLTEASVERTIKALVKAFGWNGDLNKLTFGHEDADDSVFVGKECKIVCEEEEYEGKTRIKIRWINPISNDAAMEPSRVSSLISRLNATAKAAAIAALAEDDDEAAKPKPKTAKKTAEKYTGRTQTDDGDEIPF